MTGRRSKSKGRYGENQVVDKLQDNGLAAERMPLSGSLGGKYRGDISVPFLGRDLRGEIKFRNDVPKTVLKWLEQGGADFLVFKRPRGRWVVCSYLDLAIEAVLAAEKGKT